MKVFNFIEYIIRGDKIKMKKIITLICITFITVFTAFAEMQFAPGFRFSVLGIEPTFDVIVDDLEVDIGVAFARKGKLFIDKYDADDDFKFFNDSKEYDASIVPNITIGYNFDAFDTGWHNLIGGTYYCGIGINNHENTDYYHLIGFAYRGSLRFRNNVELCVKTQLPFVVFSPSTDNTLLITIADSGGIWDCFLLGLGMTSFGLRFSF